MTHVWGRMQETKLTSLMKRGLIGEDTYALLTSHSIVQDHDENKFDQDSFSNIVTAVEESF